MNALRDGQEERQNSKEKDRHTHEKGVVVDVVWPNPTTESVNVGSTAKEEDSENLSYSMKTRSMSDLGASHSKSCLFLFVLFTSCGVCRRSPRVSVSPSSCES